MDKPDNCVVVVFDGPVDVETIRKVRQRTEMEVELERWKMRAIIAEAKLDKIRALVDKHFGGDGRK